MKTKTTHRKMRSKQKISLVLKSTSVAVVLLGCSVSVYAVYRHVYPSGLATGLQSKNGTTPIDTKTVVKTVTPVVTTPAAPASATTKTTSPAVASTPAPIINTVPDSSPNTLTPNPPSTSSTSTSPPGGTQPSSLTTGYTSTNWSGYISVGQSFNVISGTWNVPTVTGNGSSTTGDGTWIGIGGVSSSDLIQVGTTNSVSASGQVTVSAFYELLPQSARGITTLTVSPGDSMTASLNEVSPGQWTVSISDATNGQSFTRTVSYSSSNSSAEWIEEDPGYLSGGEVPFDEFNSVSFTNGSTTVGSTGYTIASSTAEPVTLTNSSGATLASPSALGSDGESFTVTRSN